MTKHDLIAGIAVDASTLPVLNHLDFLVRIVLPGDSVQGAFSIVEERGRFGCMTPRHIHTRETETFVVLEGALEGWFEGESVRVERGGVLHLPAGHEHAFRVVSETAHFYSIITPGGFEDFFTSSGRVLAQSFDAELPVPSGMNPQRISQLQEMLTPLGCTIVGPPPFG